MKLSAFVGSRRLRISWPTGSPWWEMWKALNSLIRAMYKSCSANRRPKLQLFVELVKGTYTQRTSTHSRSMTEGRQEKRVKVRLLVPFSTQPPFWQELIRFGKIFRISQLWPHVYFQVRLKLRLINGIILNVDLYILLLVFGSRLEPYFFSQSLKVQYRLEKV